MMIALSFTKAQILTHNQHMKNILIVGCGDIAMRIAPLLRNRYQLFGLIRNASHKVQLRAVGITPILADLDKRAPLVKIAGLADIVLHLAPPPSNTGGDPRTQNLLAALSRGYLPQRLVYISTSGVYGDCGGAVVNETRQLNSQSVRARRRVDAEQRIRTWAKHNGVHASILRVPGIYSQERLPLERIRSATPAINAEEDSCTNHIFADDLARVVVAAMRYAKPNRCYHASDDSDLKMGDYFDEVADVFHLPRPPRLPRDEVKQSVSPVLWSFMNESRRLSNKRMKQELKIKLQYPQVSDALKAFVE